MPPTIMIAAIQHMALPRSDCPELDFELIQEVGHEYAKRTNGKDDK
jgi:hypothetical protein